MEWTANKIDNLELRWYKRASESRRISAYHAFIQVALREYRSLTADEMLVVVRRVTGLQRLTPTLLKPFKLVKRHWAKILEDLKSKWRDCAEQQNSLHLTRKFETLPLGLEDDPDLLLSVTRKCLRKDLQIMRKMSERALTHANMRNLVRRRVSVPY